MVVELRMQDSAAWLVEAQHAYLSDVVALHACLADWDWDWDFLKYFSINSTTPPTNINR